MSDRYDEYHSRGFAAAGFGAKFDYPESGEDRDSYDKGWSDYQKHRSTVAMFARLMGNSE